MVKWRNILFLRQKGFDIIEKREQAALENRRDVLWKSTVMGNGT